MRMILCTINPLPTIVKKIGHQDALDLLAPAFSQSLGYRPRQSAALRWVQVRARRGRGSRDESQLNAGNCCAANNTATDIKRELQSGLADPDCRLGRPLSNSLDHHAAA